MEKRELRKLIRELKGHFSPEELVKLSNDIVAPLTKRLVDDATLKTILLYNSLSDEVCTHAMIEELYESGKKVLLPTVVGENLELHEYIGKDHCSISTQYAISESNGPLFNKYDEIDIAIIPGMAFTISGKRLGRGKGFYDRLLPHIKCKLVGLAFPFQIVDDIPCESHDVVLDEVHTLQL